jgi:hypothetical protein
MILRSLLFPAELPSLRELVIELVFKKSRDQYRYSLPSLTNGRPILSDAVARRLIFLIFCFDGYGYQAIAIQNWMGLEDRFVVPAGSGRIKYELGFDAKSLPTLL